MTELQEIFIRNLKRLRHEKSFSQSELAEKIGKTSSLIGTIEIARTQPSFETIESIANALEIPAYTLFLPTTTQQEILEKRLKSIEDEFSQFKIKTTEELLLLRKIIQTHSPK